MAVRRLRQCAPGPRPLGDQRLPALLLILAVDGVGEGRREEGDLGLRARYRSAHIKDDVVACAVLLEMQGIDAARPILPHDEAERGRPAGVADIVIVEMNCAPLRRLLGPAMAGARTARACH